MNEFYKDAISGLDKILKENLIEDNNEEDLLEESLEDIDDDIVVDDVNPVFEDERLINENIKTHSVSDNLLVIDLCENLRFFNEDDANLVNDDFKCVLNNTAGRNYLKSKGYLNENLPLVSAISKKGVRGNFFIL